MIGHSEHRQKDELVQGCLSGFALTEAWWYGWKIILQYFSSSVNARFDAADANCVQSTGVLNFQ